MRTQSTNGVHVGVCAQMSGSESSQRAGAPEDVGLSPGEPPGVFAHLDRPLRPLPTRCCGSCLRTEGPGEPLALTTLARNGELFLVCRLCFLSSEVRELATGGGVSQALVERVEARLYGLYTELRTELEARSAARHGRCSESEDDRQFG